MKSLKFKRKPLDTLLPAHLLLDENLLVKSIGDFIEPMFGCLINTSFTSIFSITNHTATITYNYLQYLDNCKLLLIFCKAPQLLLKCIIKYWLNAIHLNNRWMVKPAFCANRNGQ